VGDTDHPLHRDLETLARELDLEQALTFSGFRSDAIHLLSGFDVFVLSSSSEGFSLATAQAMAAGVPVVATRSGGPETIIDHESSGILVPVRNPAAIAEAVHRLSEMPELATRLARAGREAIRKRFSLEAMIGKYEALYTSMLPPRTSPCASLPTKELRR
jgi:glycosyltransferase involved in cell wall biosynthesis